MGPLLDAGLQHAIQPNATPFAIVERAPAGDPARLPRWLTIAGAHTFDEITTEMALRQGAREANPLMRGSRTWRVAFKSLSAVAQGLLLDKLAQRYPRAANIIGFGSGAALSTVGIRNLHQKP